ncbi:MAG TPA: hypothetical protein VN703_01155 [Candidatus Sulfopaludibacter sp.]|nr:hypothetical protein [Candidatus Sulfopaludibacter sp.]
MARTKNFYKVNKLPGNALKVSEYARLQGWKGHSLVYHNINRGKADYKIVVFQGFNFIIPSKKKFSKSTHRVELAHVTEEET